MIHEIFLYSVAVGLRNEDYDYLEALFHSVYFFQDKYQDNKDPERFNKLYNSIESIDTYYKQAHSTNFFSPMADFMIKRIPDSITINEFVDADLLCYYIGFLNDDRWFPMPRVGSWFSFKLFSERWLSLEFSVWIALASSVYSISAEPLLEAGSAAD